MAERDVRAEVIGRRYDCDECGEEMQRNPNIVTVYTTDPPMYPHICPQGHRANLLRSYPGYDVVITQDEPRFRTGASDEK